MNKKTVFIVAILIIGILYRLTITSGGNFLFNMDNARDMVDVREIVILKKLRLTGPTSAVEGFYNGPFWYYLLAVPFIFTGGNPYGSIVMEILLWAIGGFFLLKLVSRFGMLAILISGSLWVASNYIVLASVYAFNPNPVTFLTPLLIYLIERYLSTSRFIYGILMWFLGGLFFNFEMNFGIFVPFIVVLAILLSKKTAYFKNRNFWISFLAFIITLVPQLLFDLKHQFIMSKSIIKFLSENSLTTIFNPFLRISGVYQSFYNTLSATLMNQKIITQAAIILFFVYLFNIFKKREYLKDKLILITVLFVLVPFFGYVLLPVQVNPWHLGAEMVASIILLCIILSKMLQLGFIGKITAYLLSVLIIFYAFSNIFQYFTHDRYMPNLDPSSYKNEIAAIDYVYSKAGGKNFKVYTYLPSVYDYPYQYLFWWYGKKTYGYIPLEYVYSPNKPLYIPSQDKFKGEQSNFSGLVFLIKEPDRIKLREAWEGEFKHLEFVSKEMVGPIEVEVRRETSQS